MERFPYGDLKVFGGRSHPALTGEICRNLGREAGRVTLYNFSDGENYCQIEENVRGADVFVVQPTGPPANHNIMELLIMLDAFKRSSASRVTAVLPYYGYARQDRKDEPRVPITAKLIADLIVAAGADRVLCVDLHAAQIQGFFKIPVDHLFAAPAHRRLAGRWRRRARARVREASRRGPRNRGQAAEREERGRGPARHR